MKVTGIEIDGRLYDFVEARGSTMWDACKRCAFNVGAACDGCPCIDYDKVHGGNTYLRARDDGGRTAENNKTTETEQEQK